MRAQSGLFLPADTYRVSVLAAEIKGVLQHAYSSIWVAGEAQRLRPHSNGHLYLELVEKGAGDRIVGRLEGVVWRRDLQRIRRSLESDELLREGQEIRCRGNLDFYPGGGRLQFVIREIDPVFTIGLLARRRQEVLVDLRRRRLADLNGEHELAAVPLQVGLVTAPDSAAYHDFLSSVQESGLGFRVAFAPASVQGPRAESEIARALRRLGAMPGLDCLALIRGGGSRSDLAAFDSLAVSETICASPLPVLTGLGHEIDQSVSDVVAHTSFKTPTAVAEFLVQRIAEQEGRLGRAREALRRQALAPIQTGRKAVHHAVLGLRAAELRVGEAGVRLQGLGNRLCRASGRRLNAGREGSSRLAGRLAALGPRSLDVARSSRQMVLQRLVDLSRARSRESGARLEALARLVRELSPHRTLRRGFSITRDASGRAVRTAVQVELEDELTTELASGTLSSRVTSRDPRLEPHDPRPEPHDPRPEPHDPRPESHDPRPEPQST